MTRYLMLVIIDINIDVTYRAGHKSCKVKCDSRLKCVLLLLSEKYFLTIYLLFEKQID